MCDIRLTTCCFVLWCVCDDGSLVLGKFAHLFYTLVTAMRPRMLITYDEQGNVLNVPVRVGQVRFLSMPLLLLLPFFTACVCRRLTLWLKPVNAKRSLGSKRTPRRCC